MESGDTSAGHLVLFVSSAALTENVRLPFPAAGYKARAKSS